MNRKLFKAISFFGLLSVIVPFGVSASGNHYGETKYLEYRIEYLDPLGVTTVNTDGITYHPFGSDPLTDPKFFPEQYFGSYPLYFSGETLGFRVYLKNTGNRTYRNLRVETLQEYLNTDGGSGDPFPEGGSAWDIEELRSGEEVVLSGAILIPADGEPGLDQTHLWIKHYGGGVIVDDPQAGIWCPVQ